MAGLSRVEPTLPVGAYRTFSCATPLSTHTRIGTCEEAGCAAHERGWRTVVDERTEMGQRQAHYIRSEAGRHYVEHPWSWDDAPDVDTRDADAVLPEDLTGHTVFLFPAGQQCFTQHRIDLDRPAFFSVRPGDWRAHPARHEIYRYANGDDFVDEFATNQERLAEHINRG